MTLYTLILMSLFSGVLSFISQRKHILMALLSLEALILIITTMLIYSLAGPEMNTPYMFIILLAFGACEASLGLALLVSMTRMFGADTVNILSNSKC